jgi:hypothetical protein
LAAEYLYANNPPTFTEIDATKWSVTTSGGKLLESLFAIKSGKRFYLMSRFTI